MSFRIASLLFFSASAVAQISAPNCTGNSASWQWTFNSLGQSPCDVTAYMMSTCNEGEFTIGPLSPGSSYSGPDGPENADLCHCSTVGYSLFSACGACQGEEWINWTEWIANCTKTLPRGSYPNPIPSGMRLAHWALLDVANENHWNPNKSYADTSSPEIAPGSILGPSGVSKSSTGSAAKHTSSTHTSSSSASSTTSPAPPPPGGARVNTGAIVGGAVGCVAAILIASVAIFYLRQRSRERSAMAADVDASQPQRPLSDGGTLASSSSSPVEIKFYDPSGSESTELPGNQGVPHLPDISSQIESESTLAYAQPSQPSQPQDTGYFGHPAV